MLLKNVETDRYRRKWCVCSFRGGLNVCSPRISVHSTQHFFFFFFLKVNKRSTWSYRDQQWKDTQFFQFGFGNGLPAFIGLWVSWWWMHDTLDTHINPCSRQSASCPLFGHSSNPDHHGDPQRLHCLAQCSVTEGQERLPFSYGQLRGG